MSESRGGSSEGSGRHACKPAAGARGPAKVSGERKPTPEQPGQKSAARGQQTTRARERRQKPRAPEQPEQQTPAREGSTQKIVPIYPRLPRGPHPLGAPGVVRNQRTRIHGGMIEAIAMRGYRQTSVKLVIGLAGVSRRSFYEQFSGKEECFMVTFDLIANRAIGRCTRAYRASSQGDRVERMRAALSAWVGELEQNPKALRLAIAGAQTAGAEGSRRLRKTTAVCERLLSDALADRCPSASGEAESPGVKGRDALPPTLVRAIVGGLRHATLMRLLDDDTEDLGPLVEAMLKWSLIFDSPAARRLRARPCANSPFPNGALELEPAACGGEGDRGRLLRSAIALGLRHQKIDELCLLQIADEAGLPFEAIAERYASVSTCYVEALDALGDELLALLADPELGSKQRWPRAVCRAIDSLLNHLAGNPARLMTLAAKGLEAGPAEIANLRDLTYEVATLLTAGAPARPRTRVAVEAIAGGLWHVLNCEVLAGRGHRLPTLTEHLAYLVLTPYVGPDTAVEAIEQSRAANSPMRTRSGAEAPSEGAEARSGGAAGSRAGASNGAVGARTPGGSDNRYRRLAERRSAKWVSTTPTSTESTITTIKGA
jgi:AcrR family transcriptional regulator